MELGLRILSALETKEMRTITMWCGEKIIFLSADFAIYPRIELQSVQGHHLERCQENITKQACNEHPAIWWNCETTTALMKSCAHPPHFRIRALFSATWMNKVFGEFGLDEVASSKIALQSRHGCMKNSLVSPCITVWYLDAWDINALKTGLLSGYQSTEGGDRCSRQHLHHFLDHNNKHQHRLKTT